MVKLGKVPLQFKKVDVNLLKNGVCPRCGRPISLPPLLTRFEKGFADFYKCGGGHTWIIPAIIVPEKLLKG